MNNIYLKRLQDHINLFSKLSELGSSLDEVAGNIANTLSAGGKLLLCGNGGSAADCQHLAAEFTGRFIHDRKPLAALSLTTDTSALTCISNDYSFDEVFSRQILALGRSGDCLIVISTSGNSENVIRAVAAAKAMNILTIGFLGKSGGKLMSLCDLPIVVPSETTARIQEAHIFLGHIVCEMVEIKLGLA